MMCSIDAHNKQQLSYDDYSSISGGKKIPSNLTIEPLDSLGATYDFIYCWLK